MSYIQLHETVWNHPKIINLSGILEIDKTVTVAHMARLWTWCVRYADDGDITEYSPYQISDAADWRGNCSAFYDGLINSKLIDLIEDKLYIHNWDKYAGKLLAIREYDRVRKRTSTGKKSSSEKVPTEFLRNSTGEKTESVLIPYTLYPIPLIDKSINSETFLEEEKPKKRKKVNKEPTSYIPLTNIPELDKAFNDFNIMRNEKKKPLSEVAAKLLLKHLEEYSKGVVDVKIKILEKSTIGGYTDIYPLNNSSFVKKEPPKRDNFDQRQYPDGFFESLAFKKGGQTDGQ